MDFKGIAELIKVMSDSKITDLEIEENGVSIKMKKDTEKIYLESFQDKKEIISSQNGSIEEVKINKEDIASESLDENSEANDVNVTMVNSPIVGTFYGSPAPDKESFVKVGTKIKKGDTLCIIEAMKLMNEIESDVDGEIVDILVRDGDMVEYGQPLFKIKP
ncbi:acetyl-CoA carboxylase biotin carboxyl carrier protein [Clostridium tetanomorphum]|uniref:Biotin carboxyl carrier protein of acetyl-CoA carboxylase n=1 Tax=Clostridium tetanomorphum TaxID=1553 RepID=A0A923EB00_CLOTT|nr:acetyl-CoA carboxylase biotin carboxyl carrier protein [Clostridium tetanomorphum]KAJ49295.1 acetyl-CoA carboxylase, biotin carboxyl carrier protein [Clostridium tetanomorphum DSM 665]KAJ53058.1 acetyl-CoA carboxylase, biotin carboxyl carrier protein [Clostridium tetanomorphum DSM 665]MBC2398404.1 acetyl-CoA carboxylase biotin carboxyl carrier protein [Clostridium tetanomorphum]MBP1865557.1 acetyl-CoA carboxylase biotin carboxyl carrier protein [Clostridium tetanomorphum]NRS86503.1 acetyl-C